ncbi:MAG: hypothetical protein DMD59_08695 [Gemmatimonadetes bacterium]|nr:MAG: hypothetical protein DMD59_08695 [Gemmatimonadota bacterium]
MGIARGRAARRSIHLPLLPKRLRIHLRYSGRGDAPERARRRRDRPLGRPPVFGRIVVAPRTRPDREPRRRHVAHPASARTSSGESMTHEKPSKNEDEYFARRDAELLRQQRAAAQHAAAETERGKHHMKCPKCGYDLITHDWDGVQIDQCTHCHGVWFDADEAEALMKTSAPNILARVFRAVAKGVTRK